MDLYQYLCSFFWVFQTKIQRVSCIAIRCGWSQLFVMDFVSVDLSFENIQKMEIASLHALQNSIQSIFNALLSQFIPYENILASFFPLPFDCLFKSFILLLKWFISKISWPYPFCYFWLLMIDFYFFYTKENESGELLNTGWCNREMHMLQYLH